MEELKKCPFCGKSVATISSAKEVEECECFEVCTDCGYVAVICDFNKGGCGAASGFRRTVEEAIQAWNKRVE